MLSLNFDSLWLEVSLVCGITAFGSIFFGHFEEHTPKFKRVLKLILLNVIVVLLAKYLGRTWSFSFIGILILGVIYIHGFWLPGKGINGLTGEPRRKYYELKGWTKFLDEPGQKANKEV